MISQINRVVITVANQERSKKFYQDVLAMTAERTDEKGTLLKFANGCLQLQHVGDEMRHHALEGASHFSLHCDFPIDELLIHLNKHHARVIGKVEVKQGRDCILINDPDNNLIELCCAKS